MKLELSISDMQLIIHALNELTIKGKDAPAVGKFLTRIGNSLNKSLEKEHQDGLEKTPNR